MLETRLIQGVISYKKKHIVKREGKWKPSDRQATDLMNLHKSTNDIMVQFVSKGNGGIEYNPFPTPLKRKCFAWFCCCCYRGEDD